MCESWRKIETAPKEYHTLLLTDGITVSEGGWLSGIDQGADYEGQSGAPSGCWWSVADIEPTHWMPLPAPPREVTKPNQEQGSDMTITDIDREVAEKVFGGSKSENWKWWKVDEDGCRFAWLPPFSSEIEYAWEVVEKLRETYPHCSMTLDIDYPVGGEFSFYFVGNTVPKDCLPEDCATGHEEYATGHGKAEVAPLAICKAALAAMKSVYKTIPIENEDVET